MDTIIEQLVKIKLGGKEKGIITLIFVVDFIILTLLVLLALTVLTTFLPLMFLAVVGILYGSYKLMSQVSIEYEYIFINGDLDVDKIIAKSSRQRVVSIKCSAAEKYGVYTGQQASGSVKNTYFLCNADDQNKMYMIVPHKSEGMVMIVFAPDERLADAIKKAVPRLAK